MNRLLLLPLFLFAAICSLAGCTTVNHPKADVVAREEPAFVSPDQLTGVYTNGDVLLHWKNNATAEGGNWVEFATPGSEYTKLLVFLNEVHATDFVHPRVAPDTTFIYHIQPFFGQPTKPVNVTTGEASTNAPALEEGPLPPDTNHVANVKKVSIRSLQTFAQATPADLSATLSSPTSVDLRWSDVVTDEDGYLVEVATQPEGPFSVCALLPPDTESFRKIELPAQTACYFRVRPFFYGKPSATATVLTPPELKSSAPMQ